MLKMGITCAGDRLILLLSVYFVATPSQYSKAGENVALSNQRWKDIH